MKQKPRPLVLVEWEDSAHQIGYWNEDKVKCGTDEHTPILVEDVGFLMKADKKRVIVAQAYFPTENDYRQLQIIPRGMVKKVTMLDRREKRK